MQGMRRWWLPLGGLLLVVAVVWWTVLIAAKEQTVASSFGQFALAAITLLTGTIVWIRREFVKARSAAANLDRLADHLASEVRSKWSNAAAGRGLSEPLPVWWRRCRSHTAGPIKEATNPPKEFRTFDPLPGLTRTIPSQIREDETTRPLRTIFGGLKSGRLIITGDAGTGKSSVAILLLLDVLDNRHKASVNHRRRIPVPVLLTAQGWDPNTPIADWIIAKLSDETALLRGHYGRQAARHLLDGDRIAVFLDGFDELPAVVRPKLLKSLSAQATFRIVLISRTDKLVDRTAGHLLTFAAAVELCPVTPKDAAQYLLRPLGALVPEPWRNLTAAFTGDPEGPLAKALTNPLNLTLLRDVYPRTRAPGDDLGEVGELLDTARFGTEAEITGHLLDHLISAAYRDREGQRPPDYTVETAHHTLTVLARQLTQRDLPNLEWWRTPDWIPTGSRMLLSALLGTILGAVTFGLLGVLVSIFANGIDIRTGIELGMVIGLSLGLGVAVPPPRPGRWALVGWLVSVIAGGLGLGLVVNYAINMSLGTNAVGVFWVSATLPIALRRGLAGGTVPRMLKFSRRSHLLSIRRTLAVVTLAAAVGFVLGVSAVVMAWMQGHLVIGLTFGLHLCLSVTVLGSVVGWLTAGFARGFAGLLYGSDINEGDIDATAGPIQVWRRDLAFWIVYGLTVGISVGLVNGLTDQVRYGLTGSTGGLLDGLIGGLGNGLLIGLMFSRAWMSTVSQIHLTLRYRTPLRLNRFLDDSRERHLLHTVGPRYEFRHATHKDRLARPAPQPNGNSPATVTT